MKQVMIGIPSATGMIPLKVMSRLIQLDKPKDCIVNFGYVERMMIDKARNGMAQQCLKHGNDYLMFVDDDQICDKDILVKMIALDKDIVGCAIPSRNGNKELAMYEKNGDRIKEFKETREIGAVGMGSTLIKAQVLKEMIEVYGNPFQFETRMKKIDGEDVLVEYSEDINFCRRARELGFQVYGIAGIVSRHIGLPKEYYYDGEFKQN